MTLLFICHDCKSPIHGEFIIDDGIRWHKDKAECARLKALVNNPFVLAAAELGRTVAEKNAAYGSGLRQERRVSQAALILMASALLVPLSCW